MNFKRKIITLSIILSVLVIGYVLGIVFSPERVEKRRANVPLLTGIEKDKVWKIKVKSKDGELVIAKNSNGWSLSINNESFPADKNKIERFIDAVEKVKKSKIITNNPDNWKNFDVTKNTAKRFILYDKNNKEISDLYIGKEGLGGKGFYVRSAKSNEVIQTDSSSISYYLNTKDDFWSYLKVFPENIKKADVIKITINKNTVFDKDDKIKQFSYTLFKGDSKNAPLWKVEGNNAFKVDDEKVGTLIDDLISMEGNNFEAAIKEEEAGLSDSKTIASFTLQNDEKYSLIVGNKKKSAEQFYVKRDKGSYVYLASVWKLKKVFKSLDSFKLETKETGKNNKEKK